MPSDETRPVSPIPGHLHTVTPRLVVRDGAAAIDFYRDAFGAIEVGERFTGPNGELIHAEVRIGDSVVMISDEGEDGAPARARSPSAGWSARSWRPIGRTLTVCGREPLRLARRRSSRWPISSTATAAVASATPSVNSGC